MHQFECHSKPELLKVKQLIGETSGMFPYDSLVKDLWDCGGSQTAFRATVRIIAYGK